MEFSIYRVRLLEMSDLWVERLLILGFEGYLQEMGVQDIIGLEGH